MARDITWRRTHVVVLVAAWAICGAPPVGAQQPADADPPGDLAEVETRLAERYDRLELLVGRLAELSQSTQPRRAALLRRVIAQSREENVAGRFDEVISALERRSYSSAIEGQTAIDAELKELLELLLEEDRGRQIESERKRIARYLQDLNRLIRLQRGLKARTEGGDDQKDLSQDQRRAADDTKELGDEIEETEGLDEAETRGAEASDGASQAEGDGKPSQPSGGQSKPNNGEPNEGQPGEGEPTESQPNEGQPSQGQPSQGQPSQGQPGAQGQPAAPQSQQQPPASPMQQAAEQLRQAQQRMQQAQKLLDELKRQGAFDQQQEAVQKLEQAKAELERILRQLREEELERMLVMLEARFRKMLQQQIEVYDETQKLAAAPEKLPAHELEIASARESRKERLIAREAERALILLREDGTSVAFPEAIEQARDDMQHIAERLAATKVDLMTQMLEEDVPAAAEEALAALQRALEDLREQRARQQSGGGGAAPGEQPLVHRLAELRMIRSLQVRINRRTERYGEMIEGEQAREADLLEALDELAERQQQIMRATQELHARED